MFAGSAFSDGNFWSELFKNETLTVVETEIENILEPVRLDEGMRVLVGSTARLHTNN